MNKLEWEETEEPGSNGMVLVAFSGWDLPGAPEKYPIKKDQPLFQFDVLEDRSVKRGKHPFTLLFNVGGEEVKRHYYKTQEAARDKAPALLVGWLNKYAMAAALEFAEVA